MCELCIYCTCVYKNGAVHILFWWRNLQVHNQLTKTGVTVVSPNERVLNIITFAFMFFFTSRVFV